VTIFAFFICDIKCVRSSIIKAVSTNSSSYYHFFFAIISINPVTYQDYNNYLYPRSAKSNCYFKCPTKFFVINKSNEKLEGLFHLKTNVQYYCSSLHEYIYIKIIYVCSVNFCHKTPHRGYCHLLVVQCYLI
jgi:hypothetical protein